MSTATYDTVYINNKVVYTDTNDDSHSISVRTQGIQRDNENYILYIPLDQLIVAKSIESKTGMITPYLNVYTLNFMDDLDGSNIPKIQTKAFTNEYVTILSNSYITSLATGNLSAISGDFTSSITTQSITATVGINVTGLSGITCLGNSNFGSVVFDDDVTCSMPLRTERQIYMQSNNPSYNQIYTNYYNITQLSFSGNGSRLYQSGTNLLIENNDTNSSISMKVKTSGGTVITPITINSTDVSIITPLQVNGTVATDRQIHNCYYNINSVTDLSSTASRLYHSGATLFVQSLKPSSSINFTTQDAGNVTVIPFIIQFDQIIAQKPFNLTSNIITQTANFPLSTDTTSNTFRKSVISTKCDVEATGSAASSLEIVDGNTTGKGLIFISNASSSALNNIVNVNDQVICGRRPKDVMATVITNWGSTAVGIRIASTSSTSSNVVTRAGPNIFTTSSDTTTPFGFNNKISMTGTSSSARTIGNVSVLNFYDIQATSGIGEIYVNSNSGGSINYVSYTNNFSHIFTAVDGSSNSLSCLTINTTAVSTSRTFEVRSTSTPKLQISTATDGLVSIKGENTASLNSNILFQVRNSSNVLTDIIRLTPTSIVNYVPFSSSVTPTSFGDVGYVYTSSALNLGWYWTQTDPYSFASITFPITGTYNIIVTVKIRSNSTSSISNVWSQLSLSTSNTSFSTGDESIGSNTKLENITAGFITGITPTPQQTWSKLSISSTYRATSSNVLYIMGIFTTSADLLLDFNFSATRLV